MYHIDEENSDVIFEVNGEKVAFKIPSYSGGGTGGKGVYLITVGDKTVPTDKNTFSALRILVEIASAIEKIKSEIDEEMGEKYIRKDRADYTRFLLSLFAGAVFGVYKEGLSGATIDADGNAELGALLTRLKATLAELQVNGPSVFLDNLSSEEFISGFIGGKGWAIQKKEVPNALGVVETKYHGELDSLTVRETLRVFEMIISQLLGENDNRIFTAMMEVDHYDPETGKVWLDTQGGKFYNPFRVDDYIMVQQFNGMPSPENNHYVTKRYELVITEVGSGSAEDGKDRLDWVKFKNFTCGMEDGSVELITKGDTFVRVDNASDPDRKGIMQIITVGNKTPYLDIIYGLKTDPENYLKGRLGNLEGIRHHLFGWLKGFGEYLTNLYAVGDFRLKQTGEGVDTKIEMLQNVFSTSYQRLLFEMTDEDNYLSNATFMSNMDHWLSEDDIKFITLDGEALQINKSTVVQKDKYALVELYEGTNCLHICNASVKQLNADIRKPGTHKEFFTDGVEETQHGYKEVKNTLYLGLRFRARTGGNLTIGFQGADTSEQDSMPLVVKQITSSFDWQEVQASGTWDGIGDFVISYTGDMYISLVSITDNPLSDYKKEVGTSIEQTATNIRLLGTNINNLKGTVTNLGIELDAAKEKISIYANKVDTLEGTVNNLGIELDAANSELKLFNERLTATNEEVAQIKIRYNDISLSVSQLNQNIKTLDGKVLTAKDIADKAKELADKAVIAECYEQSSDPWSSWDGGTEYKHVGAIWKNTSDGKTYRYIGFDNSRSWECISDIAASASFVQQKKDSISSVVANFDSNGRPTSSSGIVTTSNYNTLYSQAMDDYGVVTRSEISTFVTKDQMGQAISNIKMTADNVDINGIVKVSGSNSVKIGGFNITENSIGTENKQMWLKPSGLRFKTTVLEAGIGDTVQQIAGGNGLVAASFIVRVPTGQHMEFGAVNIGTTGGTAAGAQRQIGLSIVTSNGDRDVAIDFLGKINTHGSSIAGQEYGDIGLTGWFGVQHLWPHTGSGFQNMRLYFVNGILTKVSSG